MQIFFNHFKIYKNRIMNKFKAFIILFSAVFLSGCFDIPEPLPPPIVGKWNVKISVKDSNCRKTQRGNVYTEQWNISYINRKVVVRTVGSSINIRAYEGGYISGDKVFLNSVSSSSEKMKMDLIQENDWTARGEGRLETSRGTCYAYCVIELTK